MISNGRMFLLLINNKTIRPSLFSRHQVKKRWLLPCGYVNNDNNLFLPFLKILRTFA